MKNLMMCSGVRILLLGALLLSDGHALGEGLNWDTGSGVSVSGSGCRDKTEIMYLSAGDGFSVIMTNMNIHLSGRSSGLSENRKCRLDVPVKVSAGYYVTGLTSDVHFGYIRSGDTYGYVSLKINFLFNQFSYRDIIGMGGRQETHEPLTTMRNHSDLSPLFGQLCQGKDFRTSLRADLQTFAKRESQEGSFLLQSDGLDIRADFVGEPRDCRSRPGTGGGWPFPFPSGR